MLVYESKLAGDDDIERRVRQAMRGESADDIALAVSMIERKLRGSG